MWLNGTTVGRPAMRTASEIACDLIRESEGFRAAPYLCPAGVPTVGYGFTRYANGSRVLLSDHCMERRDADAYLQQVVWREYATVQTLVPGVEGSRLAALIDFTYNVGSGAFRDSTLRKCALTGDWPAACVQLRRWVHGGKPPVVLPGLVVRREREIKLIEGAL